MPLELPGFYLDTAKNRYFPISSKPKSEGYHSVHSAQSSSQCQGSKINDNERPKFKRKRRSDLWYMREKAQRIWSSTERDKISRQLVASNFGSTTQLSHMHVPTFGKITAFCTTKLDGECWRFIGDNRGWLYRSTSDREDASLSGQIWMPWSTELNLQPANHISSISLCGSRWIATGTGSAARIAVQDVNVTGRTCLLSVPGIHDIWASHIHDSSVVLGGNAKAVYISDIDSSASPHYMNTHSDVFSVAQGENLIYTGSRNGNILRFDKRTMDKRRGHNILGQRFNEPSVSPVLHLSIVRDSQLLVSQMNGELQTFDLRFLSGNGVVKPVVTYEGHFNEYTQNLGIALDIENDFLYAAGQDCRIRGWSLSNGRPIQPTRSRGGYSVFVASNSSHHRRSVTETNPFLTRFNDTVETLQVSRERKGMCLWAGCDHDLYQYHLGQHGIPITFN